MESEEKEFFNMINQGLAKARENVEKTNKDCQIALKFMKKGKTEIKQFLSLPHHSKRVSFERSRIHEGTYNYNIRCLMDNDFISEIADMGYSYDCEHSTSKVLVFINLRSSE